MSFYQPHGLSLTETKVQERILNALPFCYISSTSYYMIITGYKEVCTMYNMT